MSSRNGREPRAASLAQVLDKGGRSLTRVRGSANRSRQVELFQTRRKRTGDATRGRGLKVAGFFAGIGGIELGLSQSGHETLFLCENEPGARAVLQERFREIPLHGDIRSHYDLPASVELVTGGFPCQDLSQAGLTAGIRGERSGLVDEVFALLARRDIPWVLLENVSFMLRLNRGAALDHLVTALEDLGYRWAYRIVDSRSMGLPQRRERVYLLASKTGDPRDVILVDDSGEPEQAPRGDWRGVACGFYWTEGLRGLGWAHDAVPTLKAGSTIGIPSPPAVVLPEGVVVTPGIGTAERLQGFPEGWTEPTVGVIDGNRKIRESHRWKLVGNAVTVGVARWIGQRLCQPGCYDPSEDEDYRRPAAWPDAAWGIDGERGVASVSRWPLRLTGPSLRDLMGSDWYPLSARATRGFLQRAERGNLRFPEGFLEVLRNHVEMVEARKVIGAAD